jgi:hypothetical protein
MGRGHHDVMSDEKPDKPDPIEDVRKGLGLLFRAAKSTLDQLPKLEFEEAVVSGAREVGRAIESVTGAIDKQIFKRGSSAPKADAQTPGERSGATEPKPDADAKPDSPPKPDENGSRGPRVG